MNEFADMVFRTCHFWSPNRSTSSLPCCQLATVLVVEKSLVFKRVIKFKKAGNLPNFDGCGFHVENAKKEFLLAGTPCKEFHKDKELFRN